jgi:hypothetical protein
MATLSYKKHVITSYIRPSEDHKELVPGAAIHWKTNHDRLRTYFLRSINYCSTSKAAHPTALKEGESVQQRATLKALGLSGDR